MRIGSGVDNIDVKVAECVDYYKVQTQFNFLPVLRIHNRRDPDPVVMKLIRYFFNAASHLLTYEFFFFKYRYVKEDNEKLYYVRCCDGNDLTFIRIPGTTGIYLSALRYLVPYCSRMVSDSHRKQYLRYLYINTYPVVLQSHFLELERYFYWGDREQCLSQFWWSRTGLLFEDYQASALPCIVLLFLRFFYFTVSISGLVL